VFEYLEDFLELLLSVEVFHSKSTMSGKGVDDCFGHVLVIAHFAKD